MLAIFEWLAGGAVIGCGTVVEFDYWRSEGVVSPDAVLGRVIGYQPSSPDAR